MKSIVMACLLLLPMSLIATSYICGADDPSDEKPIIPAPTSPELVVRIPLESRHTFSSTEASDELTVYWIKQLPVRYPENFAWYQDDEDDTGFRSRVAESAFAVVQTQRPEKKPNATVPVKKTTVVGWVYADDPPPDPHTREWLADCVFDPTSAKWYLVTGRHRTAALTLAVFPLDIDKPASDWPMREFPWLADKEKWPKPLKCQSQWRGRVDDSCSVQRLSLPRD